MSADEPDEHPISDRRAGKMSPLEIRLYHDRAGLVADDAVRWWERYILSTEAAWAVSKGIGPEEFLEHREQQRQAESQARAEEGRRHEKLRAQAARLSAERAEERRRTEVAERERRALEKARFDTARDAVVLATMSDRSVIRIRTVGDGSRVDRLTHDSQLLDIGSADDVDAAFDLLVDHAENSDLTLTSIRPGDAATSPVLRQVQPCAPLAAGRVVVDGRPLRRASSPAMRRMLIPVDPQLWPDHRQIDADIDAVGDLFLTRDPHGSVIPLGFFDSDAAAVAAGRSFMERSPLLRIERIGTDGATRSVSVYERDGYLLAGGGETWTVQADDIRDVVLMTPEACEIRLDELTHITIDRRRTGVTPREMASLLVLEDRSRASQPVPVPVADPLDECPDGVVAPLLTIDGDHWAAVDRPDAPVSLARISVRDGFLTWIHPSELWAGLEIRDLDDPNAEPACHEIGRIGGLICEIGTPGPRAALEVAFRPVADVDVLIAIGDWLDRLSEIHDLDLRRLALGMATGWFAGAPTADQFSEEGRDTTETRLDLPAVGREQLLDFLDLL